MNKNHKYIITKERKGQIIFIVLILLAVAIGLLVAAVVSGHVDQWLTIQEKKAEKNRSADGGASTDHDECRKDFYL